ncbi:hypothetical protein BJ875DRAFT_443305 [Amylocarpus encephaloides]|uniref:Mitochondrial outer membrane protein n=1 Tax=Amylocarpus encephaloides TaxID=45428 RepID=A0A9P7YEB9_9HELO|nr:hypothetical protein BJ875DRAFT_443305 [Amylocarpus encephaloides]
MRGELSGSILEHYPEKSEESQESEVPCRSVRPVRVPQPSETGMCIRGLLGPVLRSPYDGDLGKVHVRTRRMAVNDTSMWSPIGKGGGKPNFPLWRGRALQRASRTGNTSGILGRRLLWYSRQGNILVKAIYSSRQYNRQGNIIVKDLSVSTFAMPPTTASDKAKEEHGVSQNPISRRATKVQNFFSIPAPVKALFDRVPVLVYPPNELPQRAPKPSRIPSLYVFSSIADAAAGKPSFNPSCLKWQAFLNIAGVNHRLVASSNHASPTGVLPFLLPAASTSSTSPESLPVPSNKLVEYVEDHGAQVEEPANLRYEAYRSLLDYRIRNAWLYTLYLEPLNFSAVAYPLYVSSTTTNPLVRASISHQLISAAEAELLKNSSIIDIDDLYSEADKAFEALSILLGDDPWFFGSDEPTLYDASVFGYTQLLLDDGMGWEEKKLCRALRRRTNLVQHRERLLVRYFGG